MTGSERLNPFHFELQEKLFMKDCVRHSTVYRHRPHFCPGSHFQLWGALGRASTGAGRGRALLCPHRSPAPGTARCPPRAWTCALHSLTTVLPVSGACFWAQGHRLPSATVEKGNPTSETKSCARGDFWIFDSASVERSEKEAAAFAPCRCSVINGVIKECRMLMAAGKGQKGNDRCRNP